MERIDVAIVGGGPGGSSAAIAAADQGADVVVFEKGVPRADRDRLGPDSTDAAGILDYWVDIMGIAPSELPDDVLLSTLDGATFHGPSESVTLRDTTIDSSYDHFGYTFHRARFDDWLRDRATDAGATYRVGTSVTDVETSLEASGHVHLLRLADGTELQADYLILADGPQRTVTIDALDQFMPAGESVARYLSPDRANHIAYQEHRRIPADLFDETRIHFWWGVMPGHTAYPWIFPNDDNVARIGLTQPIGTDLADVDNPTAYPLLDADDEQIPPGRVYLRRLLEREFPGYDLEDFPLVEDRGKRQGTEAYPISSTRPIESPTKAGIAVVGGAMGATSAFHEGGDHVAVRTGDIAGRLAARGDLRRYNDEWHAAIGTEVLRNVTFADLVRGYGPTQWDSRFATARQMLDVGGTTFLDALRTGIDGLSLFFGYKWTKYGFKNRNYVQLSESEYTL